VFLVCKYVNNGTASSEHRLCSLVPDRSWIYNLKIDNTIVCLCSLKCSHRSTTIRCLPATTASAPEPPQPRTVSHSYSVQQHTSHKKVGTSLSVHHSSPPLRSHRYLRWHFILPQSSSLIPDQSHEATACVRATHTVHTVRPGKIELSLHACAKVGDSCRRGIRVSDARHILTTAERGRGTHSSQRQNYQRSHTLRPG
jgi:hypothetical protein